MKRRQFLGFAGVSLCGIAGCASGSVEDSPNGRTPVDESDGNVANPVIVLTGKPSKKGTEYRVEASVQTNGADTLVVTHNDEDVTILEDGEGQVIASSASSTADSLPEDSLLVIYGVWDNQRDEIFRWRVQEGEVSSVDGWNPFETTQASR